MAAPVVFPKEKPRPEVTLPPAPPIRASIPDPPAVTVEVKPPPPEAPPPKKRRARVARKNAKAEPVKTAESKPVPPPAVETKPPQGEGEAKPAEAEPAAAAAPPPLIPKLEVILTAEERKEYDKRLDGAVDRAKVSLAAMQGKSLSGEQKEAVGRIQSFLAQAEQARQRDLVSAVSLAERADLLSRDLLERLR